MLHRLGDFPSVCNLQCQAGFYPQGTMRCGYDHKFSGGSCARCDPIARCPIGSPTQPGGLSCKKPGDSTCSSCEDGYTSTVTAGASCTGVLCAAHRKGEANPAPPHGRLVTPCNGSAPDCDLRYPVSIGFGCDAGYVLSDTENRSCTTSGGWSSPFPRCIETCETEPCRNGANCSETPRTRQFECTCLTEGGRPLWEGERCEIDVDECDVSSGRLGRPNPWPPNGGCDYLDHESEAVLARCINTTGGFHCGRCLGPRDCCRQGSQPGSAHHQLPCGGAEFNTLCSTASEPWTPAGCVGPAVADRSSFSRAPAAVAAGGRVSVSLTPLDTHGRLSADNGITAADDLQGLIYFDGAVEKPQRLQFKFSAANGSSHVYEAALVETVAGSYQLNVSVRDQLPTGNGSSGSGPVWLAVRPDTSSPADSLFVVVPGPADPANTVFGGCYFGTSTRRDACYCVEARGCRTLPGVRNRLTVVVRDQYDNIRDPNAIAQIRHPKRDPGDVVTADVLAALPTPNSDVQYSRIVGWEPAVNSSGSYVFGFVMPSLVAHTYVLNVSINGEQAFNVSYEYIFHTNLDAAMCR